MFAINIPCTSMLYTEHPQLCTITVYMYIIRIFSSTYSVIIFLPDQDCINAPIAQQGKWIIHFSKRVIETPFSKGIIYMYPSVQKYYPLLYQCITCSAHYLLSVVSIVIVLFHYFFWCPASQHHYNKVTCNTATALKLNLKFQLFNYYNYSWA